MKITIENFGPISKLTFDLDKDLHMIFGKNAIGKSYGAYCVYCLLKNLKDNDKITSRHVNSRYHRYYDNSNIESFIQDLLKTVKTLDKNKPFNFNKSLEKFIVKQISTLILPGIKNSFQNTFSSLDNLRNRYSDKNYKISFTSETHQIVFNSNSDGSPKISKIKTGKKWEALLKDTKTTKFTILCNGRKKFGVANDFDFMFECNRIIQIELNEIINLLASNVQDIYFLPASRSGLYQALNAFTPIIAELTQNRFFLQNKNIELPSLPEPLSDYFIDLSTLNKKNVNKEFSQVISKIENEILFGQVEYDDETKKIIYIPNGLDLKLDLSEASSMVAELSPIVIFLRHIYNNKFQPDRNHSPIYYPENRRKNRPKQNILFIEEPEAHLHPEIQVKIVEVFRELVELGIKIIMTSHSNYILNKLNNLILDNKINSNRISAYHLIKTNLGCIVNDNMNISKDGIFDDNFTDITRELYDERMTILERNG